ncbi:MAG: PQQ-binding-like beta-propeller repeat protein, partial [Verrucomicrobiota bacterium]
VIMAGFGTQAHAWVFMFDGSNGTPRLLAHLPYEPTPLRGGSTAWISPTPRLAAAFQTGYRRGITYGEQPQLAIKVREWQRTEEADGGPDALLDTSAGTSTASEEAPTVKVGDALSAMEVMLCAALCENGLIAPAGEAGGSPLDLEVRFGFRTASLRLSRQAGQAAITRRKESIPENHIEEVLRRLVFEITHTNSLSDFSLLGDGPFSLLDARPNRVVVAADGRLASYDPGSGKRLWPPPSAKPPGKPAHDLFVARPDASNVRQIFRLTKRLAAVDPASGQETPLAPDAPAKSWAFTVCADGAVVTASGTRLCALRNGEERWHQDELSEITAGPAAQENRVFTGTAEGLVVARALDSGKELWRAQLSGPCWGEVVAADGLLLVFVRGEDSLTALRAANGLPAWKQSVGDILLKAPVRIGNRWLVAGKNNRILLLAAADGAIVAGTTWPAWLVDILPVAGASRNVVACTDIRGRLTLLDAATLKPLREDRLPGRPAGELLYAPAFPVRWGAPAGDGDNFGGLFKSEIKPALLM